MAGGWWLSGCVGQVEVQPKSASNAFVYARHTRLLTRRSEVQIFVFAVGIKLSRKCTSPTNK